MKKIFLFMLLFRVTTVFAQKYMVVHVGYASIRYAVSSVDSISFEDEEFLYDTTYVNLGLSSGTLWATCNVGAKSPEGYGCYFSWGETKSKEYFSSEDCATYGVEIGNISGTKYDAATSFLGELWQIPTKKQFSELTAQCTWTKTIVEGITVFKGIGPNGNSIIIPANGWISGYDKHGVNTDGAYWLSEEYSTYNGCMEWMISPSSFHVDSPNPKYLGQGIRAVRRK